jgi:serine kinase of HPr protein (carbohydrate metabolism regulator)
MRCSIAELITEGPAAGGLAPRCKAYLWEGEGTPDITIHEEKYRAERYHPQGGEELVAYMESAYQFYLELPKFDGFYLHSSAVVLDGKAYLFSGYPGAGKSTHAGLWLRQFGDRAVIINDDKPALRRIDGVWYAYGTPWCGKDGINANLKAPVAGVCFMKKAQENRIRRLNSLEAMQRVMSQTIYKFQKSEDLDRMLGHLDLFLQEIPVYELENRPEPEAVRLSYKTMFRG